MIDVQLKVNFGTLNARIQGIINALNNPSMAQHPVRRAFRRCAVVYRSYLQERFYRNARGGGDWKALKESTILGRGGATLRRVREAKRAGFYAFVGAQKKGKTTTAIGEDAAHFKAWSAAKKRRRAELRKTKAAIASGKGASIASILIDTGTLVGALSPEFQGRPGQIERQIKNGIQFGFGGPGRERNGRASIADIARYHNSGGARNRPPRRRILVPPDAKTSQVMAQVLKAGMVEALNAKGAAG